MAAVKFHVFRTCSCFKASFNMQKFNKPQLFSRKIVVPLFLSKQYYYVRRVPIRALNEKDSVEFHKVTEGEFDKKTVQTTRTNGSKPVKTKVLKLKNGKEITAIDIQNTEAKFLGDELTKINDKRERLKQCKISLEGKNMISEAMKAGFSPQKLFVSPKGLRYLSDLEDLYNSTHNPEIFYTTDRGLQTWSGYSTSPGILVVFKISTDNYKSLPSTSGSSGDSLPITLVCDGVRTPDNIAGILRSAVAAGCCRVIFTAGCCDIWDGKVLRAASGAHFKIPIMQNIHWHEICNYITEDYKVYICDNGTDEAIKIPSLPYHQVNFVADYSNICLIVGNEARGLSERALNFALTRQSSRIFIPMCNDIESLNVAMATTVICFEINRQIVFAKQASSS